MAYQFAPKAPTAVVERRWTVLGAVSVATSVTGVTIDSATVEGDDVVFVLSGGTAGTTGRITATVTTNDGTAVETLSIPINTSAAAGETARDICLFALRKVYGNGNDPEADALTDALERLNDMLAEWDVTGAVTGAPYPLLEATVLYVPNAFLSGIKHNLAVKVADLYGRELDNVVANQALKGLQLIKTANVSDIRPAVYY